MRMKKQLAGVAGVTATLELLVWGYFALMGLGKAADAAVAVALGVRILVQRFA